MESTEFKKGMWLVSNQNGGHYLVESVARNRQAVTVRWITRAGSRKVLYRVPMYRATVIFKKEKS
jgi:hypothetical protein